MTRILQSSEPRTIQRSQINLNPCNPKRHGDDDVTLQKRNFEKVGYVGGIVWNEETGNLIDGHRRIMAMDMYYKYDGTPEKDYKVRVEVVHFDEKTEKEQLTYMAVGNTRADLDLIANYINEIDTDDLGLSTSELDEILSINGDVQTYGVDGLDSSMEQMEILMDGTKKSRMKGKHIFKENDVKSTVFKDIYTNQSDSKVKKEMNLDASIIISFKNRQERNEFLSILDLDGETEVVDGERVLELMD